MKNNIFRLNRWLDRNEIFKFLFMISFVLCSMINIQFGNLFIGVSMILAISALGLYRILISDRIVDFDRSKYQVPQIGEIVIVKKDFYYDGTFKRYINHSFQGQKPNWWKISKGTELVILHVEETLADWKIRFFDQSKGDMYLYYLDTKKYWETKANIRNSLLNKLDDMSLFEKMEEYFIKRNLKRRMIVPKGTDDEIEFRKVLNTLRENKVMVEKRKDGIYIRLAGGENMINSDYFVKVVDFRDNRLKKLGI